MVFSPSRKAAKNTRYDIEGALDLRSASDKLSLDITWLRDESLEDTDNLPDPAEIVENLQAALDWATREGKTAPLRSRLGTDSARNRAARASKRL